jgi:hypothetical protein
MVAASGLDGEGARSQPIESDERGECSDSEHQGLRGREDALLALPACAHEQQRAGREDERGEQQILRASA